MQSIGIEKDGFRLVKKIIAHMKMINLRTRFIRLYSEFSVLFQSNYLTNYSRILEKELAKIYDAKMNRNMRNMPNFIQNFLDLFKGLNS